VAEHRLVAPGIANPPGTKVILTFGQSNAANWGEERYAARGAVHVFNMFDMKFYRAIDPLPGASVDTGRVYGGSVWGRLGDRLIDAGFARSVLFVPIAFGASYVEDWAPGGGCYPRLMLALHRLKRAGITVDLLCWQQGEANANHTSMTADEYRDCFRAILRGVREAGVKAQVYVALATLCENDSHPFQNSAEIRLGQKKLVSLGDRVLPGPDLDQIGIEHRRDGCHFSASGQELAAQAWFLAISARPMED
jgi:Carbohydrate esterase, sialic acid-specific acetylesterase